MIGGNFPLNAAHPTNWCMAGCIVCPSLLKQYSLWNRRNDMFILMSVFFSGVIVNRIYTAKEICRTPVWVSVYSVDRL